MGKRSNYFFGFWVCVISILMTIELDVYYEAILYIIVLILQFHGFITWKRLDNNPDNYSWLSFRQKVNTLLVSLISILILFYGYKNFIFFVDNIIANLSNKEISGLLSHKESYNFVRSPLLHSFIFVFSIVAMFLQNYKKIDSWIFWIVTDILMVFFFLKTGLGSMIIENGSLIIICLFGLYDWNRKSSLNKKS